MNNVILLDFEGTQVQFNLDGWINATRAAAQFGKVPNDWLRLASTREYLDKLAARVSASNAGKSRITFVTSRRGNSADSGTWIHPRLAVKFARWLSVDFELWVDEQIDALLRGTQSALDTFNRACKKYDDGEALASARSWIERMEAPETSANWGGGARAQPVATDSRPQSDKPIIRSAGFAMNACPSLFLLSG